MQKKYFLIVIILGVLSCKSTSKVENSDTQTLNVHFKETPKIILKLSSYIDSISYVKLETTPDNLIGEVYDVEFVNGKYYIYDQLTESFFIFNEQGKFVNKIHKKGQGPEEYLVIGTFDINPKDGSIHIFDEYKGKMIVYSKDGKFLKNFSLKELVRDMAIFSDGTYLLYTPDYNLGNYRRGLWRVDKDGHFVEQLVTISDEFKYGALYPKYFCRINKDLVGLLGTEDFDNIYHITSNSFQTPFSLNVDVEIPERLKRERNLDTKPPGKVYYKQNYAETDNCMIVSLDNLKAIRHIFYDKKQKKAYEFAYMKNDIDYTNFGVFIGGTYGKWICAGHSFLSSKPNGISLTTSEEQNTILQVFHLKK